MLFSHQTNSAKALMVKCLNLNQLMATVHRSMAQHFITQYSIMQKM